MSTTEDTRTEPADEAEETVGRADAVEEPEDAPTPGLRRRVTPAAAIVAGLLAVLLLTGVGLLIRTSQLTDPEATSNTALTDTGATSRVIGDVSNTLGKVFSYTPEDTQATELAARELLAGTAAGQYEALFGQVKQQVAAQKLTLTTHVVRAGVTRLDGDSAQLLVFLDQTAERKGKKATTAAAQLSVTARFHDGHWQITDITSR
ncbi:hypothetical protein G3I60_31100 [Streptomyces sp. SID13666]|uniref:hypothetical protein n=1 Tax=Streptomyces TaxID=1883 RepID=UPI001106B223|nr:MULTISPECIES: hypothetical protein [Streptomyces]MCZ4094938.1 hypothetical protein [Streptomyces sp. H39-C1]NEA58478.1 hypothetical protein [Streptomyces sp. SID13666]NEA72533.1 hypothetical protein [Streptomyces sp. SID13588]QNA74403.1 hypothetical protein C8250_023130 [Streptomyces sp. So13.3]